MRFGGHQTFTIREGWLYKGLELLIDEKQREKLVDPFAMDYLGVGRNMAKSINHWLLATGLAKKRTEENDRGRIVERKELDPTELAEIISQFDPYFLDEGTWWILHLNLLKNENHGATWTWFFNRFGQERFTKQVCLSNLSRYEKMSSSRPTSMSTLERDLSCFLASYSQDVPSKKNDPEDEIFCPLIDLGIMTHYHSSGAYNLLRKKRLIDYFIFLYALSLSEPDDFKDSKREIGQVSFFDLVQWTNGPSKAFVMSNEDLFELLLEYEQKHESLNLQGMAGERILNYPRAIGGEGKENEFVRAYYNSKEVAL